MDDEAVEKSGEILGNDRALPHKAGSAKNFVAYYRVSTRAQQATGLGLDSQRAAVVRYVASSRGVLVDEIEEVESGSRVDRPRLTTALETCKRLRATLVIAKLDRLARNLSFISSLMDSGVEFVATDMPSANRLTIHIVSAIAEYERELISQRVRAALAAAKGRGTSIGNPSARAIQPIAVRAAVARADKFAALMAPILSEIESDTPLSLPKLGRILERRGYRTAHGKTTWNPSTVGSLRKRIVRLSEAAKRAESSY
jgi:DNA invertase Pin-like site-specific DNA recombinase